MKAAFDLQRSINVVLEVERRNRTSIEGPMLWRARGETNVGQWYVQSNPRAVLLIPGDKFTLRDRAAVRGALERNPCGAMAGRSVRRDGGKIRAARWREDPCGATPWSTSTRSAIALRSGARWSAIREAAWSRYQVPGTTHVNAHSMAHHHFSRDWYGNEENAATTRY